MISEHVSTHAFTTLKVLTFLHVMHLYNKINRLHSMSVTCGLLTLILVCCLIVSSALFQP